MRTLRSSRWLILVALLILAALFTFMQHRRKISLPYRDSFAQGTASEWTPLGGSWRLSSGLMINRSDEIGVKLVTGSEEWADYQIVSDLQLRAHGGDVGLAVRVSDAEVGLDAYHGYYAGLRSGDSSLVIGRTNHKWLEGRPIPIEGGVRIGRWYRLRIVAVGCTVGVVATDLQTGKETYGALRDEGRDCIRHGRIALRSTDTSGAWTSVQVRSATQSDLQAILQHVNDIEKPEYPIREDDYSRMRAAYFPLMFPFTVFTEDKEDAHAGKTAAAVNYGSYPLASIEAVRAEHRQDTPVRLRGIVTFTYPMYLQDDTGGIRLQIDNPESVNLGDEVEAVGSVGTDGPNLFFSASNVRLLRDRTPVSPISITPTQAASGAHEGSLVEVNGVVVDREIHSDGGIELRMTEADQVFGVSLNNDLFSNAVRDWTVGSTLRVRGICRMTPDVASGNIFNILLASASDVTVISGPPWSSGWRLGCLIALSLFLIAAGVYVFFRFERSKTQAILLERERLAHEMHDTLAQSFAGVGFYLQGMRKALREENVVSAPMLQEFDVACEMVAGTHREASASVAALHPNAQKEGDLLTLLERSTFSMVDGDHIAIDLQRHGEPRVLSPIVTDALFRVGREAITNVLRHSRARSIKLLLAFGSKSVELSIADDGVGFEPGPSNHGFGFKTMQKRCENIGAVIEIASAPAQGTVVKVVAPYRRRRLFKGFRKTAI